MSALIGTVLGVAAILLAGLFLAAVLAAVVRSGQISRGRGE